MQLPGSAGKPSWLRLLGMGNAGADRHDNHQTKGKSGQDDTYIIGPSYNAPKQINQDGGQYLGSWDIFTNKAILWRFGSDKVFCIYAS